MVHLINSVDYNEQKNTIIFHAEPKLSELYRFDHKVLLQLKVINQLPRKETAQALYTFIESLPTKPAPISLARLRTRLNLSTNNVSSQNQTIRNGLKSLQELGYLDYSEVKRGRSVYIQIHNRNPKLKVVESKFEAPAEKKSEKDSVSDMKQNLINKIAELSQNLTPENIKLIEILNNSLKIVWYVASGKILPLYAVSGKMYATSGYLSYIEDVWRLSNLFEILYVCCQR